MIEDGAFVACLKASLAKAYDFAVFAENDAKEATAFFSMGTLRSICEDIIVLRLVSTFNEADQKSVIMSAIQGPAFISALERQVEFFKLFRPGQPIIRPGTMPQVKIASHDSHMAALWARNGWPRRNDPKPPPTEQMARKIGPGTVDVLYNYIFRLTSETVHFNPRALFRTGWERDSGARGHMTFAPSNYGRYFLAYCRIYGTFLLTIYAEFFGDILALPDSAKTTFKVLRRALALQPRWPEIVTFEEMNQPVPKGHEILGMLQHFMVAEDIEDGFIAAAEKAKTP